jgi:hypothetical protein
MDRLVTVADTIRVTGIWTTRMFDARSGRLVSEHQYRNTICVNGKAYIAQWLNVETPAQTLANIYGAVGTSAVAPAAADTQLGTELARVLLGTNSRAANAVTMSFFFSTSQANGTWTEAGLFLGATSAVNNGSLLSHTVVSEVKTNLLTAVLACQISIG